MMLQIRTPIAAIMLLLAAPVQAQDAATLVRNAIDHWRGVSSVSDITMTIHRADWQRSMSMHAWTEGKDKSLVRVTAPARDQGNGTLLDGNSMWSYSPKVNRVIRVPSSLMNQSWMGSDFSNKDISRADDIVDQYVHTLLSQSEIDNHTIYEVESVPLETAAVVWGKEVLKIRDDYVVLEHAYYDQDNVLLKSLQTLEAGEMGGRAVAVVQRMQKIDAPDDWTEIRLDAVTYDVKLDDSLFTLSNLRNPRN